MAVQLPKNSSSSSFSATTCCDFTGWNEKKVKGEEREGGDGVWTATNTDMYCICSGMTNDTNSAFNDVAPPTLEIVVSLLISSRGRREGW